MKTRSHFQHKFARRFSGGMLAATLLACANLVSSPAVAQNQEPPSERICKLMKMLGGNPPQCLDQDENISPEVREQLDALQLSAMPFFNYDVAVSAGWDTILGECVESPMGGMGYHVHNMDQLANGHLNLLRPEVVLYTPTEDGSMQFGGVEYIIPAELWDSEEPPEFLGRDLHFNPHVGPSGIWALHVWVGRHNPEGIFADFNPDVSCEFAPDSE